MFLFQDKSLSIGAEADSFTNTIDVIFKVKQRV